MSDTPLSNLTEAGPTRAFVLHPDLKSDRTRRPAVAALAEAVALADALPGL
ncbi:MAG: GTP-binding protein HflX, partial [Paracoccaceae bacterium]